MIYKNYQSDFEFYQELRNGQNISVAPFELTYYIPGKEQKLIASFDGESYTNCRPDGNGIVVVVDYSQVQLGIGSLRCTSRYYLDNSDYPDGTCEPVSDFEVGITLHRGESDDVDSLVATPLPSYHVIRTGGGGGGEIPNGSVTEYKLATGAVSTSKIKDGAVTMAKLGSDVKKALEDTDIADGSITEEKLSEEVREKLNQGGGSGEKGEDGKSAYEIWLEQGNEGSEQDFLDSLKGEKGDKMTYNDLTEEDKNDLASRVPAPEVDLSEYAKKSDVPTKTSELTNDSGYVTATKVVAQSAYAATIQPNMLNVWGEVASLDITLAEPTDNTIVNEYMVQFTSGATATTLTLPSTIKWMAAPNIQPNKTYQLSVINNLGVIGEFSHE